MKCKDAAGMIKSIFRDVDVCIRHKNPKYGETASFGLNMYYSNDQDWVQKLAMALSIYHYFEIRSVSVHVLLRVWRV